eukprot:2983263-Rhodomonas_salina.1
MAESSRVHGWVCRVHGSQGSRFSEFRVHGSGFVVHCERFQVRGLEVQGRGLALRGFVLEENGWVRQGASELGRGRDRETHQGSRTAAQHEE